MFSSPSLRPALALSASISALLTAGCSSIIVGGGAGGDSTTTGVTTVASTGTTTGTGVTTSSSTGVFTGCADPTPENLPPSACTPVGASCGGSVCLATKHAYGAPTFGLRVSHITLSAPKALAQGVAATIFNDATRPHWPGCNVGGQGNFNWLFRFDVTAGTLTVGAAKPVPNPSLGYPFFDGTLTLGNGVFDIKPVTVAASVDPTCGVSAPPVDVDLPFFGDASANSFTIFPLRSLRLLDTHVTPDHDCIGLYNAAGLDPVNACQPDAQHPDFIDGGHFEAFIPLEAADAILVSPLSQTLCVFLSGDPASYGEGSAPIRCKRDAQNQIIFPGDWCASTNQPASGACADAMRFAGSFAASGTAIP